MNGKPRDGQHSDAAFLPERLGSFGDGLGIGTVCEQRCDAFKSVQLAVGIGRLDYAVGVERQAVLVVEDKISDSGSWHRDRCREAWEGSRVVSVVFRKGGRWQA
jgi:hypothetical protein